MNYGMRKTAKYLRLAAPRGFCAGVDRAVKIVEAALDKFGAPVYVRHEIVHNKTVVDELADKGAVFVEELYEVPAGAPVVFSAHGVPRTVIDEANDRKMIAVDATCPLVTKIHIEAKRHAAHKRHILIGHAGHPEVEGTMGQVDEDAITLIETADDAHNVRLLKIVIWLLLHKRLCRQTTRLKSFQSCNSDSLKSPVPAVRISAMRRQTGRMPSRLWRRVWT